MWYRCLNICRNYSTSGLPFKNLPAPKGLPIIGTTLSLIAAGSTPKLHEYVDKRHKQLGPIYREKLGPVDCVFISDPNEIRNVFAQEGKYPQHVLPEAWITYNQLYNCERGLFFMDGEKWKYHRTIMNKLLLKGDYTWIEKACDFVSDRTISKFQQNQPLNLEEIFYKWSLENIISILLGAEIYSKTCNDLQDDIERLASTVHLVFQTSAKLALIPSAIAAKYKISRWKNFEQSVTDALDGANNFVTLLTNNYLQRDSEGLLPKLIKANIEDKEIKSIVADLILAAGDTTAYAMQWLLYMLAKYPRIQQELRLNPNNEQLQQNILRETLRLYPVAPFLTRILPEDAVICGYTIPKNTIIVMSIFTTGRCEDYFDNPNEFDPDRWERKDKMKSLMLKASLPFAIGARSCIGRKIAEVQLQSTVSKLVEKYEIELCDNREIDVVLKMVAVPAEPIRLNFRKIS